MTALWGERFAVAVLEGVGKRLWGFPPSLMAPIVQQLGPGPALRWFVSNMPRYERTLRAFGGLRTHLMCTAISLVNGCGYCTFGHAYAFELIYFRERGRLFPLDEDALDALRGQSAFVIRDRLIEALEQAELHSEIHWLERALALAVDGQWPTDRDEMRVAHLVRMFSVLNSVGIDRQISPDEAHDPANKDRILKWRYATRRIVTAT